MVKRLSRQIDECLKELLPLTLLTEFFLINCPCFFIGAHNEHTLVGVENALIAVSHAVAAVADADDGQKVTGLCDDDRVGGQTRIPHDDTLDLVAWKRRNQRRLHLLRIDNEIVLVKLRVADAEHRLGEHVAHIADVGRALFEIGVVNPLEHRRDLNGGEANGVDGGIFRLDVLDDLVAHELVFDNTVMRVDDLNLGISALVLKALEQARKIAQHMLTGRFVALPLHLRRPADIGTLGLLKIGLDDFELAHCDALDYAESLYHFLHSLTSKAERPYSFSKKLLSTRFLMASMHSVSSSPSTAILQSVPSPKPRVISRMTLLVLTVFPLPSMVTVLLNLLLVCASRDAGLA